MLAMEFCHEWKVYKLVDNHSNSGDKNVGVRAQTA